MQKGKRGGELNISARDWNRTIDATNQRLEQNAGNSAALGPDFVYVKNTLGRDLARYSAVCIGAPSELPTGQNDQVYSLNNGSLQSQYANGGRATMIGILPEPIASGRIGLAQIAGRTPARFREPENGASAPICFAEISDRDDMLVASSFGPISVLSTATTTGATNRLWMVEIGRPPSLGSCSIGFAVGTWNSNPSYVFNYGTDLTYPAGLRNGDLNRLGIYAVTSSGSTPAGNLHLGRNGRYLVNVAWLVSPKGSNPTPASTDRFEFVTNWNGFVSDFGTISYGAWSTELGPLGITWTLTGNRTYIAGQQANLNSLGALQLYLPGVTVKRISSAGAVLNTVALSGTGTIDVVYLGPNSSGTEMLTLAKKNEIWGRSATAGPIP